jgi:ADP-heptose:LPS heptosyltransferase
MRQADEPLVAHRPPRPPKPVKGRAAKNQKAGPRERIQLIHGCAPGDIVCLTALPRDIMAADPNRYEIHVATHCPELWANNPHIASYQEHPIADARQIPLNYGSPMVYINNVKLHFVTAFHRNFGELEQMHVPCTLPKGDLHLSKKEATERPIDERYWVMFPGGKNDFTTKIWSSKRWQQVVDLLGDRGIKIVQCGASSSFHINPKLENVINKVGKTGLRGALQLMAHADGILTPISFPMHVAAALDKPCVAVAGGREHWWWEAYINAPGIKTFGPHCDPVKVPHRYLHTQDQLPCCMGRGCWKNKTVSDKDKSVCNMPIDDDHGQTIPTCLKMITVSQVVDSVMSYYEDGTIAAL